MGGALGAGLAGNGGNCRLGGGGALALAPTGRLSFLCSCRGPAGPASPPLAHYRRLCVKSVELGGAYITWRDMARYAVVLQSQGCQC